MILVDSDILIDVTRGRKQGLLARWNSVVAGGIDVLYSPVSTAELWAGAHPREHTQLRQLFEGMICVPIETTVGKMAGEFLKRFSRSHGLEMADALIAGCAVKSEALLWTNNRKHYPMPEVVFFE